MNWPLTFYVDALPPHVGGEARGPVIRILRTYRDDVGLYRHEWTHVKQWLRTLGLHSVIYVLSSRYRLRCEVEAYREQARHYPDDRRPLFAGYIATHYHLPITQAEALALLEA